MKRILLIFTFLAFSAQAEEYTCTYTWEGKSDVITLLIDVRQDEAIAKSDSVRQKFGVISNTKSGFLLYRAYNKGRSGRDYPVGLVVIAFDKETKHFSYSNTFARPGSNNHAYGKCSEIN